MNGAEIFGIDSADKLIAGAKQMAREIQENIPMRLGLGSNVLWVLQKPLDATWR